MLLEEIQLRQRQDKTKKDEASDFYCITLYGFYDIPPLAIYNHMLFLLFNSM